MEMQEVKEAMIGEMKKKHGEGRVGWLV